MNHLAKIAVLRTGCVLVACSAAVAAVAQAVTSDSVILTEDGAYVVDARSKLAWPRCVEGMAWNGKTCTGAPRLMTHAEATAWAANRAKADGVPWRLPRVTELRRWAGKDGKATAAVANFFPGAPLDWYWTMTASIDSRAVNPYNYGNIAQGRTGALDSKLGVQQGWAVNMATGAAEGDVSRRSRLVVRLVSSQP